MGQTSFGAACGGKALRLARLSRCGNGRSLVVPMDHSVTIGPMAAGRCPASLSLMLADAGVDAIVVHKGRVRTIPPRAFADLGLIVHLSAGTVHHRDRDAKVLVGDVEEALSLGADAVSVHVNVGSVGELDQLADLGRVAGECARLGVPLLAMMYARGEDVASVADSPAMLAHLGAIAVDLGADMVKLPFAGSVEAMRDVVASCPIPVYVAGGTPRPTPAGDLELARAALASGAAGLSFGRCVFEAEDPFAAAVALAALVHETGTGRRDRSVVAAAST
ncbi:transaldolase [Pseudonocardia sp. CNS-139]|nr:transaldolase [Pseudonocardia sp. CNS-139]